MKSDLFTKHKGILYLSLSIITLITIYPLFGTGIGCGDDIHNYITAYKGDVFHMSAWLSRIAGRFYYILTYPIHVIPYLPHSMFVTKLFHVVPILLCFILFAMILFRVTGSKEFAYLFLLFSLTLTQISGHTSLFVTYPFFFSFSFSLLLVSLLFLLRFLQEGKRSFLVWSVVLFAIGLLFYEVYLLLLLFIFLILYFSGLQDAETFTDRLKTATIRFLPFLGVGLLYIAVYLSFRHYYPSTYDGTTVMTDGFKWGSFFHVLWSLSYTSIPLTVFERSRDLLTQKSELVQGFSPVVLKIILNARLEWIIKAILVGISGYILLMSTAKTTLSFLLKGMGIAILLVFVPHIPLAMTTKYTFYTSSNMIGYVTTFFSVFGIMLLATLLVNFIITLFNFSMLLRKIAGVALLVVLISISIITDLTNYTVARDIHSANVRLNAIDELMKAEFFTQFPKSSKFFSNELYSDPSFCARNLTEQGFNWSYYILEKSGTYYDFIREAKDFREAAKDSANELYYVSLKQAVKTDDLSLAIGRIDRSVALDSVMKPVVKKATVMYYSPYKFFTISFTCGEVQGGREIPVKVNNVHDTIPPGKVITFSIYNTKMYQSSTIFTIEAENIDLKSIMISNMINWESKIVYL